jgi:hypothetical protein
MPTFKLKSSCNCGVGEESPTTPLSLSYGDAKGIANRKEKSGVIRGDSSPLITTITALI